MGFRLLLAYLLCPLAGPVAFALMPLLGYVIFNPIGMVAFTGFVAQFSYPVTVLVGYPVLYFLVKRREKRWWIYTGSSFAIGLACSLVFGPLGVFVVFAARLTGSPSGLLALRLTRGSTRTCSKQACRTQVSRNVRTLMTHRAWYSSLTPLRRIAFWAACVFWVIWASWFRLDALIRWSQVEVAAFVLFGAAMASLAVVEALRMV